MAWNMVRYLLLGSWKSHWTWSPKLNPSSHVSSGHKTPFLFHEILLGLSRFPYWIIIIPNIKARTQPLMWNVQPLQALHFQKLLVLPNDHGKALPHCSSAPSAAEKAGICASQKWAINSHIWKRPLIYGIYWYIPIICIYIYTLLVYIYIYLHIHIYTLLAYIYIYII